MKSITTALALALATTAAALPALAQDAKPQRQINVSKQAAKAITELQVAVVANDTANIPARVAAAQAAAKTAEDRYVVAQLQLKAATAAKDEAGMIASIDAMIASGAVDPATLPQLNDALAKLAYGNKQYDRAAAAAERVLAGNPASADTLLLLGETRAAQGRHGEAVTLFQRAIDARTASGAKADESWYRRAIAIAHQGKQPTLELARKWVAAHPSPASWRDAISIYRNQVRPDNELLFDTLRLARAVGAMNSGDDASMYAFYAIESWAGADAKSVLDDAVARGVFNRADPKNKELFAAAQTAKGQDRAWLTASAKEVAAAPTGRNALKVGDGFYGVGDYTRAVELYRLALSKGSVDANSVKLRIGAALARSGDKAAATAALKEVGGPQAELAKFWLLHLSTSA